MGKIKKCSSCKRYTLQAACPSCGEDTTSPEPPAFSFPDRYGKYRRQAKTASEE
ncbi:MAG: RNA-protein complex protein Nop10 [Candidatus Nanohaloarchaea archaeon]|nr:RNA-protein complex protein Nop10 [Candidatus Nanohaloarchaea archaeon]